MRIRVLVLALAAVLSPGRRASPEEGFTLVRNAKNPTAALGRAQVRELALGKKRTWPHGPVAVLVLTRPGTPELHWFASSIVGLTDAALMARIKEQVFKGDMRKPIVAAAEQDVLTAVASDEGAIGVVTSATAKSLPPRVAVLEVH